MVTLILEDGTLLKGNSFGAEGEVFGELVFNTSMMGYQEILTDPANAGQVVVMTYPEIGNCGINKEDFEGNKPSVRALIVKNYFHKESHYKSKMTLGEYLKKNGVLAIQGIDTRALVKKLRSSGTLRCLVTTRDIECVEDTIALLKAYKFNEKRVFKAQVVGNGSTKVAVIDYGVNNSILKTIAELDCTVTTLPIDFKVEDIEGYDAVVLSSGYGDPREYRLDSIKGLMGKLPILGICIGAQILGLALGAKIRKLTYGHRGVNQPVVSLREDKTFITSQNHSWSVDEYAFGPDTELTYKNLNDDALEGFECKSKKACGIEFYPTKEIIENWLKGVRK